MRATVVLIACVVAGCATLQGTTRTKGGGEVVRIKPREAKKHALPPIGFRVDTAGTAMLASKFPDDGLYLTMSGPPGGPLLVQVYGYAGTAHDVATLEAQIRANYDKPWFQPFTLDQTTKLSLGGADRLARTFLTGKGHTRTRWCAALVPAPKGAAEGLVVVFGDAAGAETGADCAAIAAHAHLAPVLRSFQLD